MNPNIHIRKYNDNDFAAVSELFFDTVHTVNAADYTAEQLFAWAPDARALQTRRADLLLQKTLIAETDGNISGFGSIDKLGYLDLLFVRKNFLRRGVATALCAELEKDFAVIHTHASVTAKPFFEKRGYVVISEQEVERRGIQLINYAMLKQICV